MVLGVLDLGIDPGIWPWIWLFVAVVFALIELTLLAGSFVLLPFAVSAFIASMLGFYGAAIELQWAVFVFGGAVLFYGAFVWARRFSDTNTKPLGVGADRLVGMVGIVTEPISRDDADRRGRVSVVGEVWGALSEADVRIEPGAKVRITAMLGTRVIVEPIPFDPVPPDADTTPNEEDHP